jgi:diadenosine tetraphosphate (Ap4A) HIT family hydrolase
MSAACVFCLANGQLAERQILLRGEHLYLCAPLGQLVEGWLIVAPHECVGCFAHAPVSHLEELATMQALVTRVYADEYGVTRPSFYEQGRAGGGAVIDALGGFPHHAHLCCVPLDVDLHPLLGEYAAAPVDGPSEAAAASAGRPYAYVEAAGRRAVYVPRTPQDWRSLEQLRVKPRIAELIGLRGRADWRSYPGEDALERVADRFQRAFNEVT